MPESMTGIGDHFIMLGNWMKEVDTGESDPPSPAHIEDAFQMYRDTHTAYVTKSTEGGSRG